MPSLLIFTGRSINRVVIHPVQTNLIITMHSMPKAVSYLFMHVCLYLTLS